jgi:hypothetical protein
MNNVVVGPLLHNSPPLHIVPECWGEPWVQGVGTTHVKLLFVQWTPNGPKLYIFVVYCYLFVTPCGHTCVGNSQDKLCHPTWWAWVHPKVRIHRIAIEYEPSLTYMYEVTPPKLGSGRLSQAFEPVVTQIGEKNVFSTWFLWRSVMWDMSRMVDRHNFFGL